MQTHHINPGILIPYAHHPFSLYEGQRLHDMAESIRENGILSPVIVRPHLTEAGKFEILCGHNRVNAAKEAGLSTVPAIIKEGLTESEAAFLVTESNLIQRSFADLCHSERAFVLKNHLEAVKDKNGGQGKRNDLCQFLEEATCAQVAHKLKTNPHKEGNMKTTQPIRDKNQVT
jgi:ParB family chromosome partitioning protein